VFDLLLVSLALPIDGEQSGSRRSAQARAAASARQRTPQRKGRTAGLVGLVQPREREA
jgi:hypothetical protein